MSAFSDKYPPLHQSHRPSDGRYIAFTGEIDIYVIANGEIVGVDQSGILLWAPPAIEPEWHKFGLQNL